MVVAAFSGALGCSSGDDAAANAGQGGSAAGAAGGDAAGSAGAAGASGAGGQGGGGQGGQGGASAGAAGAAGAGVGGFGGGFSCVGKVPPFPKPTMASLTFPLTAVSIVTGKPVAGVTLKSCAKADVDCASPVFVSNPSGSNGAVTSTIPLGADGFDGYFQSEGSGLLPSVIFYSRPLVEAPKGATQFAVISAADFSAVGQGAGATLDASRGYAVLTGFDCAEQPAEGVTIAVDAADGSTTRAYSGASPGSLDPAAKATTKNGYAFFFNVPPGPTTARLAVQGTEVGHTSVVFRPGFLTFAKIEPSPTP